MCVVLLLGFAAAAFVGVGLGTILGGGDNGGAYLFLAAVCVGIIIAINKFEDIKAKEEADFEAHKKSEWIRNHKKDIMECEERHLKKLKEIKERFPNRCIMSNGRRFVYNAEEFGDAKIEEQLSEYETCAYEGIDPIVHIYWCYKKADVVFFQHL